jgi:hypothetical protein
MKSAVILAQSIAGKTLQYGKSAAYRFAYCARGEGPTVVEAPVVLQYGVFHTTG